MTHESVSCACWAQNGRCKGLCASWWVSRCVTAGRAAEDSAVASPLGRGRFARAADHGRKQWGLGHRGEPTGAV